MLDDHFDKIICLEKKFKVLYLDNDKESFENYFNFFKSKFLKVEYVKTISEAAFLLEEITYDIIISDIEFPDGNIFQLIKKLKLTSDTLIILFSKSYCNEYHLQSNQLNIHEHILKPIELYLLDRILEQVIQKYNYISNIEEELFKVEQYNNLLAKNGVFSKTNTKGIITYVNDYFCHISGYSRDELIGKRHNILKHPSNPNDIYKNMWKTLKDKKKDWHGVFKNLNKKGKTYYQKTTIKPIFNKNGKVIEYIALRNTIDSSISTIEQLTNKIESLDLSVLVLVQIEDYDILDKFYNLSVVSKIEKIFGYELLCYLPNEFIFDKVYNLGEGKYALLASFYDFEKEVTNIDEYFNLFIQNVKHSVVVVDEIEYDINIILSYSFGKYMLYDDARFGLAKALDKKTKIEYSNDSSIQEYKDARKNMETISMVKIALDNYNIISYFQPIINNKTKKIEKYESLVRLINENGDILSPKSFLTASKQGTYYNKITQRVLSNSFKMLKVFCTKISINISSLDIENDEIRTLIYSLLEENENYASNIIFELLEDENVKNFAVIEKFITKVKSKGVQIAIDDFGAGYSNFERLLKFQPDILKIDGSLIKDIVVDKYSRSVVETIVLFAKKQNIQTIAEFVENENIFNVLTEIGIDYSQGYYFGKPQSKEEITNL